MPLRLVVCRRGRIPAVALVAVTLLAGCRARTDRPATVPVRGVVIYHGEPVAAANVVLQSDQAPRAATGTTGADGTFALGTFSPGDGAVPGVHRATVSLPPPATAGVSSVEGADYEAAMAAQLSRRPPAAAAPIPARYADPNLSGLSFEIAAGRENVLEIRLED